MSVFAFAAFCALIYATTGANLGVVSEMFSLVWLSVMALFPLSLLLLRFNRGRLRRETSARLSTILFSLFVISPVILAGNVAINPKTAGYFAIYVLGVLSVLVVTQNKVGALRHIYWVFDQWHSGRRGGEEEGTGRSERPGYVARQASNKAGRNLVKLMTRMRRQVVCVCVKGDEVSPFLRACSKNFTNGLGLQYLLSQINLLFHMILYVQQNEETSHLKIVHFYGEEKDGVPSELESNAKSEPSAMSSSFKFQRGLTHLMISLNPIVLDEAFPEITIDLVCSQSFTSDRLSQLTIL